MPGLAAAAAAAVVATAPNHLSLGEKLAAGARLESASGSARLSLLNGGNLVLFAEPGGTVLWTAAGAAGHPGDTLYFQGDGNLVVKDADKNPLWAAHTNGKGGVRAVVEDYCEFALYTAANETVWSTGTAGAAGCTAPAPPPSVRAATEPAAAVARYDVATWKFSVDHVAPMGYCTADPSDPSCNPWEALNISLHLTPPAGAAAVPAVAGYHHGGEEWRIRFAPVSVGNYTYQYAIEQKGQTLYTGSGTLVCVASAAKGFLRPRFGDAPYRTAYDDGTLFTGHGLGDCLHSGLTWETLDEKTGQVYTRTLDEYVSDYASAGFRIWRWSNDNCAFNIYKQISAQKDGGNQYDETLCAAADQMVLSFRSHGFAIWMVPFGFHPPFSTGSINRSIDGSNLTDPEERRAVEMYFDFVVARWGAMVDVWSLMNEAWVGDEYYAFAVAYLRKIDPYHHPITTSWNDCTRCGNTAPVDLPEIEINSEHWYDGTDRYDDTVSADTAMVREAQRMMSHNKPVYLTETGNFMHNWDPLSHLRMRIRSWTAWFEGVVLMWWNTASTRNCTPCGGGNMYLGPTERGYQKTLASFASAMTDPAVRPLSIGITAAGGGVRAYGLAGASAPGGDAKDGAVLMGYAHHYANHSVTTTAQFSIPSAGLPPLAGCAGEWVHPDTGATAAAELTGGVYTSPPFAIDIALRLVCHS